MSSSSRKQSSSFTYKRKLDKYSQMQMHVYGVGSMAADLEVAFRITTKCGYTGQHSTSMVLTRHQARELIGQLKYILSLK